MTRRVVGKVGRFALWFSPNLIALAVLAIALNWMKPSPVVAEVMNAVFVIFVLGYTIFLARRAARPWDEVERASWGFATGHGWASGGFATIALFMVPPVMNSLVDLVNGMAQRASHGSPYLTNQLAVRMAFSFGGILVMVMQALAIVVAARVWKRRMGGSGEPS